MKKETKERIKSITDVLFNRYVWVGAAAVAPLVMSGEYLLNKLTPRWQNRDFLTFAESMDKIWYHHKGEAEWFNEHPDSIDHLAHFLKDKRVRNREEFSEYVTDVRDYLLYWLRDRAKLFKESKGRGFDPFPRIAKGLPEVDCTTGAVAGYALLERIRDLPESGDTLDYRILLYTSEKSDFSVPAGHALLHIIRKDPKGVEYHSLIGINPHEDDADEFVITDNEYTGAAEALTANMEKFRLYYYSSLTENGVGIRIQRYWDSRPEEYPFDIVNQKDDALNQGDPTQDPRDTVPLHNQRWLMEEFKKKSKPFEPWKREAS